jgi:hypothetical protein
LGSGYYGFPFGFGGSVLFDESDANPNWIPATAPALDPGPGYTAGVGYPDAPTDDAEGASGAGVSTPAAAVVARRSGAAPAEEEAVTLVFKDGRPSEQIHNYMLTQTTLTVMTGGRHRDIPVDELDLAATEKANHEAGVEFHLPQTN